MSAPGVMAVLVLYGMCAEDSTCFLSLRRILADAPWNGFQLLLYDNSATASETPDFPAHLSYRHDPANGGVAAAYNAGLAEARAHGTEWLLLLDQDTALTPEYMSELCEATARAISEVAAIVPRLTQGGHTHSPHLPPRLSHRALPESAAGVLPKAIWAFNSGTAVRVRAVQRFPTHYWLDFLDHAVFHELQANGGRVYLMHARLEHRLSTQKLGEEASVQRYRNVLQAERDFYREYGTLSDNIFYHLRRIKQTVGHLLKIRDKRFALLSALAAFGFLGPTPSRGKQVS